MKLTEWKRVYKKRDKTKDKTITVEAINQFDINSSTQRAFVKAMAMHWIWLYVYHWEWLPRDEDSQVIKDLIENINKAENQEELEKCYFEIANSTDNKEIIKKAVNKCKDRKGILNKDVKPEEIK